MKHRSTEPGRSTAPVGQFWAFVGHSLSFCLPELQRDPPIWPELLPLQPKDALIPGGSLLDIATVDDDVVDAINHRVSFEKRPTKSSLLEAA
jgi:hypothetical protein